MQTLGLADSSTRSESRLKSLFWPSIQSGADVDYLGAQGYWVCTGVAVISLAMIGPSQPLLALALLLFFHFGGVGVRERDLFAAAILFAYYAIDTLFMVYLVPFGSPSWILRVAITALLLSNLRATWIASKWEPTSEQAALPPRFGETLSDKFADLWPAWVWPKVRIFYYIFALGLLLLVSIGIATMMMRVESGRY